MPPDFRAASTGGCRSVDTVEALSGSRARLQLTALGRAFIMACTVNQDHQDQSENSNEAYDE